MYASDIIFNKKIGLVKYSAKKLWLVSLLVWPPRCGCFETACLNPKVVIYVFGSAHGFLQKDAVIVKSSPDKDNEIQDQPAEV